MITVGEVKRVFTDINNTVVCDVDITLFKTTLSNFGETNNLIDTTYTASICTLPGIYMPYEEGDIVYVGFANNEVSEPIILGKVHKNLPKEGESSSYAYFKSLDITDKVTLPENITIGDINYEDLKNMYLIYHNLESKIDSTYLSNKFNEEETPIGIWVDNKTIYRKVYTIDISDKSKGAWTYSLSIKDLDFDNIWYDVSRTIYKGSDYSLNTYSNSTNDYFIINIDTTNKLVQFKGKSLDTPSKIYLTLEYTK